MKTKRKHAFTLAEVLITLGIIGVVAALTIPTLIANTNANKFRNQFKKTISTLSQAALMSKAQYGFDFADTNVSFVTTPQSKFCDASPEAEASIWAIFNGTLTGATCYPNMVEHGGRNISYLPSTVTKDSTTFIETYSYSLADGAIVAIEPSTSNCTLKVGQTWKEYFAEFGMLHCWGWIDVNGTTKPNKEVTCSNGETLMVGDENYQECVVKNDAQHMTDVYPVIYHDGIVEPATNAAKYVLNTAK